MHKECRNPDKLGPDGLGLLTAPYTGTAVYLKAVFVLCRTVYRPVGAIFRGPTVRYGWKYGRIRQYTVLPALVQKILSFHPISVRKGHTGLPSERHKTYGSEHVAQCQEFSPLIKIVKAHHCRMNELNLFLHKFELLKAYSSINSG
jgi:hypothetical protein